MAHILMRGCHRAHSHHTGKDDRLRSGTMLPAENKAVSDSLRAGGGSIFRCGLGNRPGGDKVEVF